MKVLLIILSLLISVVSLASDYTTLAPIHWKDQEVIQPGIMLRSSKWNLSAADKELVRNKYMQIKKHFSEFENLGTCLAHSSLDLRVISLSEINDPKYFELSSKNGYEYFGRYFRGVRVLYITKQSIWHDTNEFAHELAHYFYDQCGKSFLNDDIEHERIEQFQAYLKGNM